MATLKITEYRGLGSDGRVQAPVEPALAHQSVTFTTAAASSAFNAQTTIVKLHPSADCYVVFGQSPTATASHEFLKADLDHFRVVTAGQKVSAYDGTS